MLGKLTNVLLLIVSQWHSAKTKIHLIDSMSRTLKNLLIKVFVTFLCLFLAHLPVSFLSGGGQALNAAESISRELFMTHIIELSSLYTA
jgi:hypothetical protein